MMSRGRSRGFRWLISWLFISAIAAAGVSAQNLAPPGTWRWVLDSPSRHVTTLDPPADAWLFGNMPPGWHITTRPAAVLFEPSAVASGRFAVEAETFLFPGTSPSGFGLFVGGRDLETAERRYVAFLIRHDGSAAVEQHGAAPGVPGRSPAKGAGETNVVVPWTRHEAVKRQQGEDPVRNVLRVEVEPESLSFLVNGTEVSRLPLESDGAAGHVGFRIGGELNLHVTTFDLIRRLAPPRPPRR
jgi:hypothetical protein